MTWVGAGPALEPSWRVWRTVPRASRPGDLVSVRPALQKIEAGSKSKVPKNPEEGQALITMLGQGGKTYDEVLTGCHLPPEQAAVLLLRLELSGKIRKNRDGRFALPPAHSPA